MGLLPLDEVRRRLRAVGQSDGGVQSIPIDRIVGSVDRSGDFDRSFGAPAIDDLRALAACTSWPTATIGWRSLASATPTSSTPR